MGMSDFDYLIRPVGGPRPLVDGALRRALRRAVSAAGDPAAVALVRALRAPRAPVPDPPEPSACERADNPDPTPRTDKENLLMTPAILLPAILPAAGDLNFKSGWDTLIAAIEGAAGATALFTVLGVAGTVIVIGAVVASLIAKRRGGRLLSGQDSTKIGGAVIAGGLLAAPKVIIGGALWFVDFLGNAVIQVLRNSGVIS